MSDPELEAIDPELDALLAAERGAEAPKEVLGRVWSRVAGSLGNGGNNGRGSTGTPSTGLRGSMAGSGLVTPLAFAARVAFVAFVAGGAAGVGLHALFEKPPVERIVYVERPVPAAIVATRPDEAVASPPAASAPRVAPPLAPLRPSAVRASPQPTSSSSLSAERELLDGARRALAQEDGARALALTSEHASRFALPQLGEEREAIAIQALIVEGRYDDARGRAARFRAASPDSLFMPAVDASLASIP